MTAANQLNGTIFTELGRLSFLQALDLSENHLSGTISTELTILAKLTYLDLGKVQLILSLPFCHFVPAV